MEDSPDEETDNNYDNDDSAGKECETGRSGRPEWRGVVDAVEFSRRDGGSESVLEVVSSGVLGEFASPAVEIFGTGPNPAVSNGLRLADGGNSGVDIAVRVGVVNNGGFGLGNGGVRGAEILLLKVERASAEDDNGRTVRFCDIDDDMREDKVTKVNEGVFQSFFVARLVSLDDGRAEFNHAKVVKTQKCSGEEEKRDQDEDELPNFHGIKRAEHAPKPVRFLTTHY